MDTSKFKASKKDGLTRAMESDFGLDIKQVVNSKPKYSSSDIDDFNKELMGDFGAAEGLVKEAGKSSHVSVKYPDKTDAKHINSDAIRTERPKLKRPENRPKTAMKIQYEAELSAIIARLGSLSTIRKNLNLNQRKMAQLLLVDPSALNRWEKAGNEAPFYIYRALEWYSLLTDKHPAMGNAFWLQQDKLRLTEKAIAEIKEGVIKDLSPLITKANEPAQRKRLSTKTIIGLCCTLGLGFLFGLAF